MNTPAPLRDLGALLHARGLPPLRRGPVTTLQLNIGRRCNLACHHCHVESSPKRTEDMSRETSEQIVALLGASPSVRTLDLTGGAPEMSSQFRYLVREARARDLEVIDRCNLTIFFEPGWPRRVPFAVQRPRRRW